MLRSNGSITSNLNTRRCIPLPTYTAIDLITSVQTIVLLLDPVIIVIMISAVENKAFVSLTLDLKIVTIAIK